MYYNTEYRKRWLLVPKPSYILNSSLANNGFVRIFPIDENYFQSSFLIAFSF